MWWWLLVLLGLGLTLAGAWLVPHASPLPLVLVAGALAALTVAVLAIHRGVGSAPPLLGVRGRGHRRALLIVIFGLLAITAVGTAVWAITGFGWILYAQLVGFGALEVVVFVRLRRGRGSPGPPGGPDAGDAAA